MSIAAPPVPRASTKSATEKREWSPHVWVGCDAFAWTRLMAKHRFGVHWTQWYVAASISFFAGVHTALRMLQTVMYGQRVNQTRIHQAPVFIIGHWRSGTTLLHELLICDPRHAYPTTYDCFCPHHLLISRTWIPKAFGWMMPKRRPMDNMAAGWDRPQEDEFALALLGQPSPYERFAFPNGPLDDGSLDLRGLSRQALGRWKATFLQFLREVTLLNQGRRLILKSPPHTCRIPTLLELFPDARFIHIVRDPYVVYPSTVNLWKSLYRRQVLGRPNLDGLAESILQTFAKMHARLDEDRKLIPPDRFLELRYEDLLRDPIGRVETIYRELDLGDFEPAQEQLGAYVAGMKNYETNRYDLSPAERETVTRRWGHVISRYGYEEPIA